MAKNTHLLSQSAYEGGMMVMVVVRVVMMVMIFWVRALGETQTAYEGPNTANDCL